MISRLPKAAAAAVCIAGVVGAGEVRLAWDPSPTPGVTNYVLHARTNDPALLSNTVVSAAVHVGVGTNLSATLDNLRPARWWFAVTAEAWGVQSDPSNILEAEVPAAPGQFRTVLMQLQWSATLTNWTDVGFFRLKIP